MAVLVFVIFKVKFNPISVMTHTVIRGELRNEVMGTGTLEARVKTTISPRIQERLAEVLVDQGDSVKAGQLLARLDNAELQQQVAVAKASQVASRAGVERVSSDEARAQAVLRQARLQHKRLVELVAHKAASQEELDKATETLHAAEADLKRSQSSILESRGQVITSEKTVNLRREQMAFTELRSPYDGVVVRRDRDPGVVVVPGSSILQLIDTREMWVSAWVDETAMAGLVVGQTARVVFRSEPDKVYPGVVARLGREADRETREFLVDVRVDQLPSNWAVGQRAEVFIETGRQRDTLTIPQQFLLWRTGKPGVMVNEDGKAHWRDIRLGLQGLQHSEVIEGLAVDEQIVIPAKDPAQALVDGQAVKTQ
ncbi:MAG: efflux RND transporter periplasmic adaptor subunit [Methylomonas sp.]|nr:efflux RND transporter periplasmic adaptor subunit [Methylomonas sp.]